MRNEEEHRIQVVISRYLDYKQIPFFAIPNGGLRHRLVAIKMKAEGVKAGVADLFIMISNNESKGLFVEVKTDKGIQSQRQKEFMVSARSNGYAYEIVRSLDELVKLVDNFKINAQ